MHYPICFPTEKLYREWLYFARVVREPSTICEDCSKEYQEKMEKQGRCFKETEQLKVFARVQIKQRIENEQLDLLEILFSGENK
jgi:hypothetical protein